MGVPATLTDSRTSAKLAGLHYASDQQPGILRIGSGKTFRYFDAEGGLIRDRETLRRIQGLVIPPAWREVWISPDPDGHLQAVGRDARNRKQYRYHSRWREIRDSTKYHRLLAFAEVLPGIRKRIARDLLSSGLQREKILATIVRLLETTSIRVGNEEYAKHNHSFGLTTFRNHHAEVSGEKVSFYFRGKSGRRHRIRVEDRHLARIVRRLQDLPGYELFQYVDHSGERHSINSTDVNEYLREVSGQDFTAKDFRTWNGTVLALRALSELQPVHSQAQARKNVIRVVESVAGSLGNTVAVCRKCYIHPAVLDAYFSGTLSLKASRTRSKWFNAYEFSLRSFLCRWSKLQKRSQPKHVTQLSRPLPALK